MTISKSGGLAERHRRLQQRASNFECREAGERQGPDAYEVHGDGQMMWLKFLKIDMLPRVSMRVNGG
jgi:hypothetical protein